jgi:hypothetical protein
MNTDVIGDNAHLLGGTASAEMAEHDAVADDAAERDASVHAASHAGDGYRVALVKSLATNNRFYALVSPESGIHNADAIENIPHDLVLGIAYPCLEDGLNDFAVVRTAYETLELFSTDEAMRHELHEIISDARRTLIRRLMELLERLIARKAHFLGTDLDEFKSSALDVIHRGFPRHRLDHMMKVNVFSSVAQAEAAQGKTSTHVEQSLYRYEFHNSDDGARLAQLSGRDFLLSLLADVLDSVMDAENYRSKYLFDRNVFQQFIALIFITYSSTDSVFYGIHKDDYGVSRDKDMDRTPLYVAIGRELRRLIAVPLATPKEDAETRNTTTLQNEAQTGETSHSEAPNTDAQMWADIAAGRFVDRVGAADVIENNTEVVLDTTLEPQPSRFHLPRSLAHEELLLGQIASICATAHQLRKRKSSDSSDLAQLILADAAHLVDILKQINVISPLAYNPGQPHTTQGEQQQHGKRVLEDDED